MSEMKKVFFPHQMAELMVLWVMDQQNQKALSW